jgi:diguanylate cyclase (GGDEF)-like protein
MQHVSLAKTASEPLRPMRVSARGEVLAARLLAMWDGGWDINILMLLQADVHALSALACDTGHARLRQVAAAINTLLHKALVQPRLPNEHEARDLAGYAAALREVSAELVQTEPVDRIQRGDVSRAERPPADYWQRWQYADSAAGDVGANPPCRVSVSPLKPPEGVPVTTPMNHEPPASEEPGRAAAAVLAKRAYHLTQGGPVYSELGPCLEAEGAELEILDSADELIELLGALPPELVIVDAGFIEDIERIGKAVQKVRDHVGNHLCLAVILERDELALRLRARRAGADTLVVAPSTVDDILRVLRAVAVPPAGDPYRILIVEDDRAQGVFAESVLRNTGMDARVVEDPLAVLDTLQTFRPDLILMDLYMPRCNGMELTTLIREQPEFLHTPIVFLSGESDEEVQFEVIDAGADDFIAKPVRPRHLIAAVQNRVQRARVLANRGSNPGDDRDARTGLHHRDILMLHLQDLLAARKDTEKAGGLLFLEVEAAAQIRERHGLAALEQVLADVGRVLAGKLPVDGYAARLGDASYLVVDGNAGLSALEAGAARLRAELMQHAFSVDGKPLRVRISVGICPFVAVPADVGAVLNASERACRNARSTDRGIACYEPPKDAEREAQVGLEKSIRDAIDESGFEFVYQPIVAVQGGEDAQFQCLLRLRDSDGKVHQAGTIVPVAERRGWIAEVDRWAVSEAIAVIARKQAENSKLRLFLTQSPVSLASPQYADWLRDQLIAAHIEPESLVIEIRMDEAIVHSATIGEFCRSLVHHGVSFCLSQFEAGLDAASLLEHLPLSFIKLGPRYLRAAAGGTIKDELHNVIAKAHQLGIKVIGHRVEDPQSAATLWMVGIDFLQGNLVQQAGDALSFDFKSAVL